MGRDLMIHITLLGWGLLILNPGPRGLGMMGRESGPEGGGDGNDLPQKGITKRGAILLILAASGNRIKWANWPGFR